MKSAKAVKKVNLFWAINKTKIFELCPFINHLSPSASSVTVIKKRREEKKKVRNKQLPQNLLCGLLAAYLRAFKMHVRWSMCTYTCMYVTFLLNIKREKRITCLWWSCCMCLLNSVKLVIQRFECLSQVTKEQPLSTARDCIWALFLHVHPNWPLSFSAGVRRQLSKKIKWANAVRSA